MNRSSYNGPVVQVPYDDLEISANVETIGEDVVGNLIDDNHRTKANFKSKGVQ